MSGIERPLEEFLSRITYGFTNPMPTTGEGPFMVTARDVNHGRILYEQARRTSVEAYETLLTDKSRPNIGDVLVTKDGTLGRIAVVDRPDVCINQSVAVLQPNEKILPRFLRYLLEAPHNFERMLGDADGTTIKHIYITRLAKMEVKVPSLPEQYDIAAVLGALDDKIEVNRKTAATLEEMARALYRSWFVDFDPVHAKAAGCAPAHMPPQTAALFPDSFSEDGLPEGWVLTRTEDLSLKIAMGPFGSNIKVSTFVEEGVPIISGHHLHGTLMKHGEHRFITEEHADRLKNSNVFEGDIVFTHAGTIGQVSMIGSGSSYERFVISQRQFYLRPDKSKVSPLFLLMYFKSSGGQHELLSNASQVGVPSIARPSSHLKAIEICLPSLNTMAAFEETVSTLFQKMSSIEQENQTLASLRDTLLPRLMSGELRVGAAREQVKEVV
jgi:type I restriction enzyme S subunit